MGEAGDKAAEHGGRRGPAARLRVKGLGSRVNPEPLTLFGLYKRFVFYLGSAH